MRPIFLLLLGLVACATPNSGDQGGGVLHGRRIPRVIYQTWLSKRLPLGFQLVRRRMLARNPGYKFIVFDDADIEAYVATHFSGTDVETAFRKLSVGAARADLWRYLVLFREGGVYLDVDSEIVVSLDEDLIRDGDGAVISREANRNHMVQYMIIAEAGHPFLARVIALSTQAILEGPRVPEGKDAPSDPWLRDPLLFLAGPPIFNRACEEEARVALGRSPPWSIWDAPDAEVNAGISFPPLRARIVGHDYEKAVVFKHEYVGQMHWFSPHWRDEGTESLGWYIVRSLALAAAAVVTALAVTRRGRYLVVAVLHSRAAPCLGVLALLVVLGWLVVRGFIQIV
jgi:inositol phosphorylceramide mannosyltransferase catalytic subunit